MGFVFIHAHGHSSYQRGVSSQDLSCAGLRMGCESRSWLQPMLRLDFSSPMGYSKSGLTGPNPEVRDPTEQSRLRTLQRPGDKCTFNEDSKKKITVASAVSRGGRGSERPPDRGAQSSLFKCLQRLSAALTGETELPNVA